MKRNKYYYISVVTTFLMFIFFIMTILLSLEIKGREVRIEMYEKHYCPYCGQYIMESEDDNN